MRYAYPSSPLIISLSTTKAGWFCGITSVFWAFVVGCLLLSQTWIRSFLEEIFRPSSLCLMQINLQRACPRSQSKLQVRMYSFCTPARLQPFSHTIHKKKVQVTQPFLRVLPQTLNLTKNPQRMLSWVSNLGFWVEKMVGGEGHFRGLVPVYPQIFLESLRL